MRLRHIEVFRALMLTGTVTEAARFLKVSQPVVTRVLQHAEIHLRFKLFERVRGRLHPTPEAITLYAEVERVYAELERLRKTSANLRMHGTGYLRVAAIPSLVQSLLPQAIQLLRNEHPDATCELFTDHTPQIADKLLSHQVDIGFSFDPPAHAAITQEIVGRGEMVLACPREWNIAAKRDVRFSSLLQYPFISLDETSALGFLVRQSFERSNIGIQSAIEVQTYSLACSLVANKQGFALLDQYTAATADPAQVALHRIRPTLGFEIRAMRGTHQASSVLVDRMKDSFRGAERALSKKVQSMFQPFAVTLKESI